MGGSHNGNHPTTPTTKQKGKTMKTYKSGQILTVKYSANVPLNKGRGENVNPFHGKIVKTCTMKGICAGKDTLSKLGYIFAIEKPDSPFERESDGSPVLILKKTGERYLDFLVFSTKGTKYWMDGKEIAKSQFAQWIPAKKPQEPTCFSRKGKPLFIRRMKIASLENIEA